MFYGNDNLMDRMVRECEIISKESALIESVILTEGLKEDIFKRLSKIYKFLRDKFSAIRSKIFKTLDANKMTIGQMADIIKYTTNDKLPKEVQVPAGFTRGYPDVDKIINIKPHNMYDIAIEKFSKLSGIKADILKFNIGSVNDKDAGKFIEGIKNNKKEIAKIIANIFDMPKTDFTKAEFVNTYYTRIPIMVFTPPILKKHATGYYDAVSLQSDLAGALRQCEVNIKNYEKDIEAARNFKGGKVIDPGDSGVKKDNSSSGNRKNVNLLENADFSNLNIKQKLAVEILMFNNEIMQKLSEAFMICGVLINDFYKLCSKVFKIAVSKIKKADIKDN